MLRMEQLSRWRVLVRLHQLFSAHVFRFDAPDALAAAAAAAAAYASDGCLFVPSTAFGLVLSQLPLPAAPVVSRPAAAAWLPLMATHPPALRVALAQEGRWVGLQQGWRARRRVRGNHGAFGAAAVVLS